MSIQKIMEEEMADLGVSSLPDRPSAPSLYSGETLTAAELRAAFDRLPRLLAQRFNALLDATGLYEDKEGAETLASLIATGLAEGHSLQDLFEEIQNGVLADRLILDGERSLSEVLAALEDTVSIPEGFESWKEYIDSPLGEITTDETLPVSGGAVFRHTAQMENDIRESIPPTEGRVVQGDPLPVAGGRVYDALEGVTKSLDGRLSSMEGALDGTYFHFETITDLTTKQAVPEDAMTYARLDRIGGNTKKCTNLLPMIPNTNWGTGTEVGYDYEWAVTFDAWVDDDGYLTIDSGGKDTGISCVLELPEELFKNIPNGAKVSTYVRYVSGSANGGEFEGDEPYIVFPTFHMNVAMIEGATYTETTTFRPESLRLQAVGVFDNLKLAITVVEGSTPVDEPVYYEGFKSAKVTAVKSYGKNLYDGQAEFTLNGETKNQTIATPNIDGTTTFSFKLDGTAGNSSALFLFTYEDGTEFKMSANSITYKHTKKIKQIKLLNWCAFVGRIYDIQLERGSTATEYKPYVGLLDTYTVPSEVQALEGYGNGLSNAYNTVDLFEKKYTEKCREIVLTGIETYSFYEYGDKNVVSISGVITGNQNKTKGICTDGTVRTSSSTTLSNANDGDMFIGLGDNKIYWVEAKTFLGVSTDSDFKSYIAERYASGNPVRIIYDLATDTQTDISEHITYAVYTKVEAGGYVVAENDEGIEAPLTMTYQVKTDPTI